MAKRQSSKKTYQIYGVHACEAALKNDARDVISMKATRQAAERFSRLRPEVPVEIVDGPALDRAVPQGAVHQGIALQVAPLETLDIQDVITEKKPLLMLDQVTDPHNVGAMLRSAAAFGVGAVIVPKDNAPQEGGVMAKAACGGMDMVPMIVVTNISHAIKELKEHGYWIAGMDGDAKASIAEAKNYMPLCLVMGAEGRGLRRLTAEHCDVMMKIPMDERMESLNVSNAAAIALYELFKTAQ